MPPFVNVCICFGCCVRIVKDEQVRCLRLAHQFWFSKKSPLSWRFELCDIWLFKKILHYTLCDFTYFFQSRFLDRLFCSAFECSFRSFELSLYYHTVSIMSSTFAHFVQKRLKRNAEPFCLSLKNQEMVRLFTIFDGVIAEDVPLRTGKRAESFR